MGHPASIDSTFLGDMGTPVCAPPAKIFVLTETGQVRVSWYPTLTAKHAVRMGHPASVGRTGHSEARIRFKRRGFALFTLGINLFCMYSPDGVSRQTATYHDVAYFDRAAITNCSNELAQQH